MNLNTGFHGPPSWRLVMTQPSQGDGMNIIITAHFVGKIYYGCRVWLTTLMEGFEDYFQRPKDTLNAQFSMTIGAIFKE